MGACFVPNSPEFFSFLCCVSCEVYLPSVLVTRIRLSDRFAVLAKGLCVFIGPYTNPIYVLLEFPISEDKETILLSKAITQPPFRRDSLYTQRRLCIDIQRTTSRHRCPSAAPLHSSSHTEKLTMAIDTLSTHPTPLFERHLSTLSHLPSTKTSLPLGFPSSPSDGVSKHT